MSSTWTSFPAIFIHCSSSSGKSSINVACEKRLTLPQPTLTNVITMPTTIRRSANYQPSSWSYEYVQSLDSKYTGEKYMEKFQSLKEAVRTMIRNEYEKEENTSSALSLVDDLQRLGISYHFVNEIRDVLEKIYSNYFKSHDKWSKMDLNLTSLGFRLLRQHGYHIPQEIFEDLKDETGNFKGHLYEDIDGMLNLYEASYHSVEDESILDEARDFTRTHLNEILEYNNICDDQNMLSIISHALAFPLHWRVPRVEAKWFIQTYERRSVMNSTLLELANLDFNMVQAIHQQDLKKASRWWKDTCWEKLGFARDHLVESFMWSIGQNFMPHFQGRGTLTKVFAMITTIDDVYDVYGTLAELEQFTDIVNRWDVNVIEELPDYMRICFLALYNSINEISYNTLTNHGFFVLPYLKKTWQDLCNSYLVEAKWYNNGYIPTLNEFLNNAYVSIGVGVVAMHAYLLTLTSVSHEELQEIGRAENIIRHASVIVRLTNDLATSSEELETGDVPKSIQCYMQESGATEVEAREHIRLLILETWKKLNKERQTIGSSFPQEFIECVTNLARMGHFAYDVNKHTYPDMMRTHVLSLFVNPINGLPYA
ncbi:(-)-beta-pinene synthase, chloroplastic [Lactuca sativa]|uniref:Uncharacterized protein n=1 Tax=Lactuca sativa TaxID=4236 RepID=A0A9R1X5K5_LACSA|nr:(-)-beta-pinene synthase, chloroplastic [Lactuca sativa]KAJ0199434.1 hypothetical protein LSAT_V11C600310920 [Lactuca sativa]